MDVFSTLEIAWRRWKHRDILQWRVDLNEYENTFLIPDLESRAYSLYHYFLEIDEYMIKHSKDEHFGEVIRKLMIRWDDEKNIPQKDRLEPAEIQVKKFFSDMITSNRSNFLQPLEEVLTQFQKKELTLNDFSKILTNLNAICSKVIQSKNILFLYSIRTVGYVKDKQGNILHGPPNELTVMLIPFQELIENATLIAKSTLDNISNWQNEQVRQKTEFLGVINQRIAQRNNLLTIIVAIVLSWVFLTFSSPFDKIRLENEYESLSKALALSRETEKNMDIAMEYSFNKYEAQITKLKAEIEQLKKNNTSVEIQKK